MHRFNLNELEYKIINVSEVQPSDLFGNANSFINHINKKFPQLKIVVRGGEIKINGDAKSMDEYQTKIYTTVEYLKKYGHLSIEILDKLYNSTPLTSASANNIEVIEQNDVLVFGNGGNIVRARTVNQQKLVEAYSKNDLLFAIGPAGTGKTYTAIALAVRALKNKEIKRIILTRPAVEAGEKLGFLPGDMKEKLDPYLQPLYDALGDMIPPKKLAEYMDEGVVQIAPLAYMRGRTLDNACVILDEAQNTTKEQLKMFLTRMGRSAKFIVTGDKTQIDLPAQIESGLKIALEHLAQTKGISIIEFNGGDNLRHPLVAKIAEAFKN